MGPKRETDEGNTQHKKQKIEEAVMDTSEPKRTLDENDESNTTKGKKQKIDDEP